MTTWTDEEGIMSERTTLLEEFFVKGVRSPVTRKMLFDLGISVLPLILMRIFGW